MANKTFWVIFRSSRHVAIEVRQKYNNVVIEAIHACRQKAAYTNRGRHGQ